MSTWQRSIKNDVLPDTRLMRLLALLPLCRIVRITKRAVEMFVGECLNGTTDWLSKSRCDKCVALTNRVLKQRGTLDNHQPAQTSTYSIWMRLKNVPIESIDVAHPKNKTAIRKPVSNWRLDLLVVCQRVLTSQVRKLLSKNSVVIANSNETD